MSIIIICNSTELIVITKFKIFHLENKDNIQLLCDKYDFDENIKMKDLK